MAPWDPRRAAELAAAAAVGGLAMYLTLRLQPRSARRMAGSRRPRWHPGEAQDPPVASETLTMLPEELPNKYRFFISAYVPRPIALVASVSPAGEVNLAPFSYSGIFAHDPARISFACVDKGREGGDTLQNVLATKEFVVHVVSEWYLEAANHTCGNFEPEVNEFREAGLTMVPSTIVRPPRVDEAGLAMECTVEHVLPLPKENGAPGSTMVVGRVVAIHVQRDIYDSEAGVILPEKLLPVARLGGNTYACLGDLFDIARPSITPS